MQESEVNPKRKEKSKSIIDSDMIKRVDPLDGVQSIPSTF